MTFDEAVERIKKAGPAKATARRRTRSAWRVLTISTGGIFSDGGPLVNGVAVCKTDRDATNWNLVLATKQPFKAKKPLTRASTSFTAAEAEAVALVLGGLLSWTVVDDAMRKRIVKKMNNVHQRIVGKNQRED